jgi:hypothetical protein
VGFRTGWVAVQGVGLEHALAQIGWVDTQRRVDFMDPGLYGFELPGGWTLVVGSGYDYRHRVRPELAAQLSRLGFAVHLTHSDGDMNGQITAFRDGSELWRVSYDGGRGVSEPVLHGEVPSGLGAILARCSAAQEEAGGPSANVDYMYEVVIELGDELVGFRHDRDLDGDFHLVEEGWRGPSATA